MGRSPVGASAEVRACPPAAARRRRRRRRRPPAPPAAGATPITAAVALSGVERYTYWPMPRTTAARAQA
jgi:hypothetical protein